MKIALAQQNYHIGNFEENTRKIIEGIEEAKRRNADIVVFSELSICGMANSKKIHGSTSGSLFRKTYAYGCEEVV